MEHFKPEGRDSQGYFWIKDERNDDYFYLKDFQHLVVAKTTEYKEQGPVVKWEALVFEDDSCQRVIGHQLFESQQEAKECIEQIMEIALKNRKNQF